MTATITVTLPAAKLEEIAFTTGACIEYGRADARVDVLTEGGVRLRLVASLGTVVRP